MNRPDSQGLATHTALTFSALLLLGSSGCSGTPEDGTPASASGAGGTSGGSGSAGAPPLGGTGGSGALPGGMSGSSGQSSAGGTGGTLGSGGVFGEFGGTFTGGAAGRPGGIGGTKASGVVGGTTATSGMTATGGAGGMTALGGAGGAIASGGAGGSMAGRGGASTGTGGASGASHGGASSAGATSGGGAGTFGVCSGTPTKAATIYAIGDSTMSVYAANVYPRTGWAQPLGDLFDAKCATVVDKALSGRSSKSFFNEGAWTPIKSALKSGDYVLIQFGHNDEKSEEPTLYTEPQTTYKQYLTTYVNDTREKQATPILLTSINRNSWDGQTLKDTHGAYPPAVRELAQALEVDLIDLTALTKAYFERIGPAETAKVFLILKPGQFANYPNGVTDNTHLQESGARTIGRIAMADAYAQKLTLASLLKAVPSTP